MRPVIDLSSLNNFVESQHFQMENLSSIKTLLKQGDFMTKLDLKDAYLTIAMNPQSQKFLRFIWKGKAYQFKALPFGLNVAPLVFTKLLKPIAAFLRKQGVRLILYLDDMLIIGSSAQETMQFTQIAMNLLASLGFTIHKEKSITTPTQIITFLGFTINSITRQISLPPEKVTKTLILCRQILTAETVSLRSLAQLLGLLESHRPAIWKAPLHFRHLQAQLIQDLQKHNHQYNVCTPLTRASKTELTWWLTNLQQVNGSQMVPTPPDIIIFTDASKKGWGAICNNVRTNGKWSLQEVQLHINLLELKGALLAVQSLLKNHRHMTASLNMDNSTAVSYINHKGGTRSPELTQITLELWNWCIQRNIYLVAHHVPGKSNVLADQESRVFRDDTDWKLDPQVIKPFLSQCRTDLFATRLTCQLKQYISWRPDPKAVHTDALNVNWLALKGYAFPPFNLLPVVLNKVLADQTELVLVAPVWQARPWWPLLLSLLTQEPVLLPNKKYLLINPSNPDQVHPNVPTRPSSRVSCLIQRYETEGFSKDVANLLVAATRSSTSKTYESSWRRWCGWCSERKINPLSATLTNILRGILNNRPPKPRYTFTWDLHGVTEHIKKWGQIIHCP